MAHLTDMEELLATIPRTSIRDYMKEAMSCYMANAYRGCIVLSYIALFDDLLSKLGELGKVNITAKSVFFEATKKKDDQEVFENYLINQLASKSLLSGLDAAFLDTLRTLRNKSAHPSGHQPSPEEARFIFYEVVTRFLSRPILSTTQLVDEIFGRFNNTNFFPNIDPTEIKPVVEEEIKTLHEDAIPQLVAKLALSVISTDTTIAKNAESFSIGLALLDRAGISNELKIKVISAKSDDPQYSLLILQLLSANGKLIIGLSPVCIARLRQIISRQIEEVTTATSESKFSHPTSTLKAIAANIDESTLLVGYRLELVKLFEKRPYSPYLLEMLAGRPTIFSEYFPILLSRASSSTFATANTFASAVDDIEEALSVLSSDMQAFELVVAILMAAAWGARGSKSLEQAKFASIPHLRAKAFVYVSANTLIAKIYFSEKLGIAISSEEFLLKYLTDETPA